MDLTVITARQIMSTKFTVLDEATTLGELRNYFNQYKVKYVLISHQGDVVGIITDRDVLRRTSPFISTQAEKKQDEDTLKVPASDIMSGSLLSVGPDECMMDVANKKLQTRVSCMPVIDAQKKVLGVITWKEFIPYFVNKTITCEQIMTRTIHSVTMDTRLETMIGLIQNKGIHHLPVMENGRIQGMISDRDIFRLTSPFLNTEHEREQDREVLKKRAHHIMQRKLQTVVPKTTLSDAVQILLKQGISCLPVVTDNDVVRGIITWRDFLKQFAKQ